MCDFPRAVFLPRPSVVIMWSQLRAPGTPKHHSIILYWSAYRGAPEIPQHHSIILYWSAYKGAPIRGPWNPSTLFYTEVLIKGPQLWNSVMLRVISLSDSRCKNFQSGAFSVIFRLNLIFSILARFLLEILFILQYYLSSWRIFAIHAWIPS